MGTRTCRALIVSGSAAGAEKIASWLGADVQCQTARTIKQAGQALLAEAVDFIIVNMPLPDGSGEALAKDAEGALLLVPQAQYDEVRARMEPKGVMTLSKPVSPALFTQAVALLKASTLKINRLQDKLSEIRLIERAKGMLMQTLLMSEAQAHRYIEKQAMDLRRTKREVAEDILRTYEY